MKTGTYNFILARVPDGATSVKDIAREADVSVTTARRYLNVMAERGEVIRSGSPDGYCYHRGYREVV